MKARKVVNFLLLGDAFTSRNITSVGLVILFFFIFYLAGGKVAWKPEIQLDRGVPPVGLKDDGSAAFRPQSKPLAVEAPVELPAEESARIDSSNLDSSSGGAESEKMKAIKDRLKNLRSKRESNPD